MTAPTYQSHTVTDFGSDATTHNANMPASVTARDLLLAIASFDMSATITTPTGWSLVAANDTGQATVTNVYAKVADGSEGGTTVNFVTSTSQRGSVHVVRVTGWAGDLEGVRAAMASGASTGAVIGLAACVTARDILWIVAQCKSSASAWGAGPPTGYSNNTKTNASEDSTASASIASATKTSSANSYESIAGLWLAATGLDSVLVAVLPVGATKSTRPTAGIGM